MTWIVFVAGIVLGVPVGMFIMALAQMAGGEDSTKRGRMP